MERNGNGWRSDRKLDHAAETCSGPAMPDARKSGKNGTRPSPSRYPLTASGELTSVARLDAELRQ
jgi:hypothetical protein